MANMTIFDKTISFNEKDVVYNFGDESSSFYYILSGKVNLYETHGIAKVFYKTCPIMSTFGVDEFISMDKRKFTAIATEKCEFLEVTTKNIEEFSSQLPGVVLNILNGLSKDIKKLNDLFLLREKSTCEAICRGNLEFNIDDEHIYIENNRKYPMLLPEIHKNHLYETEKTCPICNHNFITNNIRLSHLKFLSEDNDLRMHYEDISPLWYQLLTCPKCNYVNFRQTFSDFKPYMIDLVKNALARQTHFEPSNIKLSINDVLEEYYHFLRVIDDYKYSALSKSHLWESLMWIYDDLGDIEAHKIAKKNYSESLKIAWFNDSDKLSAENESLVTYKVSLIELENGNYKDAHSFCMKAIRIKGISSSHKKRIQNKLYEISELYRQNKKVSS